MSVTIEYLKLELLFYESKAAMSLTNQTKISTLKALGAYEKNMVLN